jgi:hypothetical protein
MIRAVVSAGAALLLWSTAAVGQGTEPAAARETPACRVRVNDRDLTGWREVRANGFTFCVPPDWRPRGRGRNGMDARAWRGAEGELRWGTGGERSPFVGREVVRVPAGEPMTVPRPPTVHSHTELVGGAEAVVRDNVFGGEHLVGAWWESPAAQIDGRADNAAGAALLLDICRTVRFTPPSS